MTEACLKTLQYGGVEALPASDQNCYKFDPPRRWQGLWYGAFEMSRFCPEPANDCLDDHTNEKIWLEASPSAHVSFPKDDKTTAGLWQVDFVGRKSSVHGGYGHLGGSNEEILIDRLLAIKRVPMYSDAELAQFHARGVKTSCLETVKWGGLGSFRDPEECFEMLPSARWRGLWRNGAVTSFFCPEPATKCPEDKKDDQIALNFKSWPPKLSGYGGLYKIDFIGRRTVRGGFSAGFGATHDMVVDHLISMKEIEPPPKQ